MQRKTVGVGLLVAALLTVLGLGLVAGPGAAGSPSRAASPTPPRDGACATTRSSEAAGNVLIVVDCRERHTVEVVHSWQAEPPGPGWPGPEAASRTCAERARAYVGVPPADDPDALGDAWTTPLRYRAELAVGPGNRAYRQWSWRVCLVRPALPAPGANGYRGSVRDLDSGATRPVELRPCYAAWTTPLIAVECGAPHRGEVLAMRMVSGDPGSGSGSGDPGSGGYGSFGDPGSGDPANPGDREQCTSAAIAQTGAEDPTYGGELTVSVREEIGTTFLGPVGTADGPTGARTEVSQARWLLCTIELTAPAGPALVGTVAGLGAGPLPLR